MINLLNSIRHCRVCENLPLGPRPIIQASREARLLIVGQAPSATVHETGIPWNDASGERLRHWLGLSNAIFYDENKVAILPMGFCYPGKKKGGDLPPRKECLPLWHPILLQHLTNVKLILLVGRYAQHAYLGDKQKATLGETVASFEDYLPRYLPLPHPSPANNRWIYKNKWFTLDVLPEVRTLIQNTLAISSPERMK